MPSGSSSGFVPDSSSKTLTERHNFFRASGENFCPIVTKCIVGPIILPLSSSSSCPTTCQSFWWSVYFEMAFSLRRASAKTHHRYWKSRRWTRAVCDSHFFDSLCALIHCWVLGFFGWDSPCSTTIRMYKHMQKVLNWQASCKQMKDEDMDIQNYKDSEVKLVYLVFSIRFKPTKHDERDAQVRRVVGGPGQVEYPSSSEAWQCDWQQSQQSQPGFRPHTVPHGAAEDGQHPTHPQAGQQGAACQHRRELEVCPQRRGSGRVQPQLRVQRCKVL